MKDNCLLRLNGERVVLVAYRKEHVEKYHMWMTDPVLLQMTASEPLSLQEEYAMQQSWHNDSKKCAFIILSKERYNASNDEINAMSGDVNLFFNDNDDSTNCEIEIMIAEEKDRHKGYGTEAIQLMMAYGIAKLNVNRFYCKINKENTLSQHLFQRLNYKQCAYVEAFNEVEYEFVVTTEAQAKYMRLYKTHSLTSNSIT